MIRAAVIGCTISATFVAAAALVGLAVDRKDHRQQQRCRLPRDGAYLETRWA